MYYFKKNLVASVLYLFSFFSIQYRKLSTMKCYNFLNIKFCKKWMFYSKTTLKALPFHVVSSKTSCL